MEMMVDALTHVHHILYIEVYVHISKLKLRKVFFAIESATAIFFTFRYHPFYPVPACLFIYWSSYIPLVFPFFYIYIKLFRTLSHSLSIYISTHTFLYMLIYQSYCFRIISTINFARVGNGVESSYNVSLFSLFFSSFPGEKEKK